MKNQLFTPKYPWSTWPLMVATFLLSAMTCTQKKDPVQTVLHSGCLKVGMFAPELKGRDTAIVWDQVSVFNRKFVLYTATHPHILPLHSDKEPHQTSIRLTGDNKVTQLMVGFGSPFADSNLLALYLVLIKDESDVGDDGLCSVNYTYILDSLSREVFFTYHPNDQDQKWHRADTDTIKQWIRNFEKITPLQQVKGYTLHDSIQNGSAVPGTNLYIGLKEGTKDTLTLFNLKNPDVRVFEGTLSFINWNEKFPPGDPTSHTAVKPCPPNCPR